MGKIERANWLGSLAVPCNTHREAERERERDSTGSRCCSCSWSPSPTLTWKRTRSGLVGLGLAWLGAWLRLACGGKFHCHASFSINLLATAGQADKSNEPPQAAGSVCRMPHASCHYCSLVVGTATVVEAMLPEPPPPSSHFFVDFILIYEDRFIWLPLLLHASHRSDVKVYRRRAMINVAVRHCGPL